MKIEERLRSAITEYTDSIHPNSVAWQRIDGRMSNSASRQLRPIAVAFLAVAALAVLISVRLMADRSPQGIDFITPIPAEDFRTHVILGGFEFKYPKSWTLSESGTEDLSSEMWSLWNPAYASEGDLYSPQYFQDGKPSDGIMMDFESGLLNPKALTIDELLDPTRVGYSSCAPNPEYPEIVVLECKKVTINGRVWGRVLRQWPAGHSFTPQRFLIVFTQVEGRGYSATALLFGTDFASRMAHVEQMLATLVIR
jgi:hypothetical protein